jgi:hypothetical protein
MSQESAAPTQAPTNGVQVTKKPGRIKTELYEFANRRGTEYPYNDNLEVEVLIVGAGFGGVFCLHQCREAGLNAVIYEAGQGYGGTWRWNNYPGARVDSEVPEYELSIPGLSPISSTSLTNSSTHSSFCRMSLLTQSQRSGKTGPGQPTIRIIMNYVRTLTTPTKFSTWRRILPLKVLWSMPSSTSTRESGTSKLLTAAPRAAGS